MPELEVKVISAWDIEEVEDGMDAYHCLLHISGEIKHAGSIKSLEKKLIDAATAEIEENAEHDPEDLEVKLVFSQPMYNDLHQVYDIEAVALGVWAVREDEE